MEPMCGVPKEFNLLSALAKLKSNQQVANAQSKYEYDRTPNPHMAKEDSYNKPITNNTSFMRYNEYDYKSHEEPEDDLFRRRNQPPIQRPITDRNEVYNNYRSSDQTHNSFGTVMHTEERLALKYPRKKIESKSSSTKPDYVSHRNSKPSSIYDNITPKTPVSLYNSNYPTVKQENFSLNTPVNRNMTAMYGNDPNVSSVPYVNDPRMRKTLEQHQQLAVQQPQSLSHNSYMYHQNNARSHSEMAGHHYMQQHQPQQQIAWGSSSSSTTRFTNSNPHQHFKHSYNNYNGDRGRFNPKLNYIKEEKTSAINSLEPPKFEKSKTTIVHDISADDWIQDELEKEMGSITNEKEATTKANEVSTKEKIIEAKSRDINSSKIDKAADLSSTEDPKDIENLVQKALLNLLRKPKSTKDSLNIFDLAQIADKNKLNKIKAILQEDTAAPSQSEETIVQSENKSNENDNFDEDSSLSSFLADDYDDDDEDGEKELSEKDNISEKIMKRAVPRKARKNELDKLNFDINNMVIRDGVLTGGRRTCTILKDNAYTEISEKDNRNSLKNNTSNNKLDDDGLKNRKNSTDMFSVRNDDNDGLKVKIIRNTQPHMSRKSTGVKGKRRKRSKSRSRMGSQINKNKPKPKPVSVEKDDETVPTDDNDETKSNASDDTKSIGSDDTKSIGSDDAPTLDISPIDRKEKEVEVKIEDNLPEDHSSVSDFSEHNALSVLAPEPIIKNTDKNYYFGNKAIDQCALCSKSCQMRLLPKHYVFKHKDYEVFISRLNPKVADIFLNNLEERSGIRITHKQRPVIKFLCYFCDGLCFLSVEDWVSHIASHTGECVRKCFEGNNFYGYLCSECNYIQLQRENVAIHVSKEHDSSEENIKILKIKLINVASGKITKLAKNKLPAIETNQSQSSPEIRHTSSDEISQSPSTPRSLLVPKREPIDFDSPSSSELEKTCSTKETETIVKTEIDLGQFSSVFDINESITELKAAIENTNSTSATPAKDAISTEENLVDSNDQLNQTVVTENESISSKTAENTNITAENTNITDENTNKTDDNTNITMENNINTTPDSNEPIKIKEEFDEQSLQIKTEPQAQEDEEDENAVLFRIERVGYKIKQNTFPQLYIFLCIFEGCGYTTTNSTEFSSHINAKTNEYWDGFCYVCESYVRADENMPLNLELKHMFEVHLKMNLSINVEERANAPSLSLKKLPGDLLSSTIPIIRLLPTVQLSKKLLIKPWTEYQNQKTHANCEEMLKENNLSNLYKCMGIKCSFSTGAVFDYFQHLKNHDDYAKDQLTANQYNSESSSWLECAYCEIFADTCDDLVQHITKKHKNNCYQCAYCFYRSFLATNIVMHRNKHHSDVPLSVLLCDRIENLPKINFEKILINRTSNIRPLHCSLETCKNKKFFALNLFLDHHHQHNHDRYLCEFCSQSFNSRDITVHLLTHGIGLFECIYCRFATHDNKKLQIHMCDKHPTKLLFTALRIFRHPETDSMPHDIAGDISSIYLVNFGQRLISNYTETHSTGVSSKSIELLENDRPTVFPPTFESGCLLNINECNKLIAKLIDSSVQIMEYSNDFVIPMKAAFEELTTMDETTETANVSPIQNTSNDSVLSEDGNESNESADEDEPTGMFSCNCCNYAASYRCVKMHHREKHKGREFRIIRTNLTMTFATSPDKTDVNEDKIPKSMIFYVCGYCALRNRSVKKILEHWKECHQQPKVKRPQPFRYRITRLVRCYYCREKYGYLELARHISKYHSEFPIVSLHYTSSKHCGECDYKYEFSETDFVAHTKSEHADAKCRTIPSDLLEESLLSHYINMDSEQFYFCTACSMESDSKTEIERHIRRFHKDDRTSKMELKLSKLTYHCSYCKHSSTDEFNVMKHIMKHHSQSNESSLSSKFFYNAMRFKKNIDNFDQMKLVFPNGLVLNKADVIKTAYGGYDHIIKHLANIDDMPSPLSKKRRYDADSGPSKSQQGDDVSRLQPGDIKRLKLDHYGEVSAKPLEEYDLSKIYTTMKIADKHIRLRCDKFAALFDINAVVKLERI